MLNNALAQAMSACLIALVSTVIPAIVANRGKIKQKVTESVTMTEGIYAKELPKLLNEIQTLLAKNVEITNELLQQERQYAELVNNYKELKEQLDEQIEENKSLHNELNSLRKDMANQR